MSQCKNHFLLSELNLFTFNDMTDMFSQFCYIILCYIPGHVFFTFVGNCICYIYGLFALKNDCVTYKDFVCVFFQ